MKTILFKKNNDCFKLQFFNSEIVICEKFPLKISLCLKSLFLPEMTINENFNWLMLGCRIKSGTKEKNSVLIRNLQNQKGLTISGQNESLISGFDVENPGQVSFSIFSLRLIELDLIKNWMLDNIWKSRDIGKFLADDFDDPELNYFIKENICLQKHNGEKVIIPVPENLFDSSKFPVILKLAGMIALKEFENCIFESITHPENILSQSWEWILKENICDCTRFPMEYFLIHENTCSSRRSHMNLEVRTG